MDCLAWFRINVKITKKLYDIESGSCQLYFQSLPGERNGKYSQNSSIFGENGKLVTLIQKIRRVGFTTPWSLIVVHLGLKVSTSVHNCGHVVNGGNTMAALLVLLPSALARGL